MIFKYYPLFLPSAGSHLFGIVFGTSAFKRSKMPSSDVVFSIDSAAAKRRCSGSHHVRMYVDKGCLYLAKCITSIPAAFPIHADVLTCDSLSFFSFFLPLWELLKGAQTRLGKAKTESYLGCVIASIATIVRGNIFSLYENIREMAVAWQPCSL